MAFAADPKATPEEARKFINDAEEKLLLLGIDAGRADWIKSTYITDDTEAVAAKLDEKAISAAVAYAKQSTRFDGLKLDGQHMNGVPACYNPAHDHKRPEDSVEALPDFFRELYETARSVKPDALVEFCPCGTAYSFFTMPHFNMSVASDPESSFQVRSKGKSLKALMGDNVPYFGDHVELSDGASDFASTVGVGGVVGTIFVLPNLVSKRSTSDLTPQREKLFAKWVHIYKDKMISRGEYLGSLYDIGFDRPEAHAIRKGGEMYYAFFAKHWTGRIELRGLEDRAYHIVDYVDGKDFGSVHGPKATIPATFNQHLLLEARPE